MMNALGAFARLEFTSAEERRYVLLRVGHARPHATRMPVVYRGLNP